MKFHNKIPTLLGLVIIIILLSIVSVAFNMANDTKTEAFRNNAPIDLKVTNISDSSFTISYMTDSQVSGLIQINKGLTKETCIDERDLTGSVGKYYIHSFTCKNLSPSTTYDFKVVSGGKTFSDNNGIYSAKTSIRINPQATGLEPAYGTVLRPDNTPAAGVLVYLTIDGAQTLSTLTNNTGSWLLPLNLVRMTSLDGYLAVTDRMTENIIVVSEIDTSMAVTDTLNDSPVPEMIIGKTYDFRRQQAINKSLADIGSSVERSKSPPNQVLGTQDNKTEPVGILITQPEQNAAISSQRPFFKGKGIPGSTVTVTVGLTDPVSANIQADQDGIWSYTPEKDLSVGRQSVTITTLDINNKPVAVTHIFSIFKSGTQVLGEATPSATLAPVVTPSPSTAPIITAAPPPTSGTTWPAIAIMAFSILFIISGIGLYFR